MHPIWILVSGLTVYHVYTRVSRRRSSRSSRSIYLTFDDGPDPEHTPRVLDLLARHGAKATFFLRGDNAEKHSEIARRLAAAGHGIGNHSFSHPSFDQLPWRVQLAEIQRADLALQAIDGEKKHVFRPPYGRLTLTTLGLCILRRQRVALWTHDSLDFRLNEPGILKRFENLRLRPGDILLFHDDGSPGIDALEKLLPVWRSAGFEFSTL